MSKWTKEEENILKNSYQYMTDDELACTLANQCGTNRTRKSIERKRDSLGLHKPNITQQVKTTHGVARLILRDF